MARLAFPILVLLACLHSAASAADSSLDVVTGKVFLDANGNGLLDSGEKGVPGVRITDGVDFVTTDKDGVYAIPVGRDEAIPYRPAQTISISWPSGKWPTGKWWLRMSEIHDAKPVDFGLREDAQKLPFVFGHISDDHSGMVKHPWAEDARRLGDDLRLFFNTGDMGYATLEGVEDSFRGIAAFLPRFPVPMFIAPGNHDWVDPDEEHRIDNHPLVGHGAMTRYCGPIRWSFDYAGVHFVGLDCIDGKKLGAPRVAVEWLDKDLTAVPLAARKVLFIHYPASEKGLNAILSKHRVSYVCAGDTHQAGCRRWGGVLGHTNFPIGVGVVTDGSLDIVEMCPAGFRAPGPGHNHGCGLTYFLQWVVPALEKRHQGHHALTNLTLGSAGCVVTGGPAESAEILLEIDPGTAQKVSLRIGDREGLELAFTGTHVEADGAPIPFWFERGEKTLRWRLLVDKDRMTFYANDLLRLTKAVTIDNPARVTIRAEGGQSTIVRADVWDLRPVSPKVRGMCHFPSIGYRWAAGRLLEKSLAGEEQEAPDIQAYMKQFSQDGIVDE